MSLPSEEAKTRVARVLGKEWSNLDDADRQNILARCSLRLARASGISVIESRAIIALLRAAKAR